MELTGFVNTPISQLSERFKEGIYNPTMLVKAMADTIEGITNGDGLLVDPSSPAVLLMEFQAVHTANMVQEHVISLRRQYPELALTSEDLYDHMSDADYVNRFASPCINGFITFAISMTDLNREAVRDAGEKARKLIIPKDTRIVVDEMAFTLLYPIVIRKYDNNSIQVSRDSTHIDPTYPLRGTNIKAFARTSPDGDTWLFFTVEAPQVSVDSSSFMVNRTYRFQKEIALAGQFCYARVFYRNGTGISWTEIKTTHSEQTFDPTDPTALLKVVGSVLQVNMPVVYTTSGLISGELRVDVYTTKGAISADLTTTSHENFVVTMMSIDEERDQNVYTAAMGSVSFYVTSPGILVGGRDELTFDALRDRVKQHALGDQTYPITSVEIATNFENNQFDIVRSVDTVTDLIFLATRKLSDPLNSKLITPANIGMATWAGSMALLQSHDRVVNNGSRLTIKSKSLWRDDNGKITLLDQAHVDGLRALGQVTMVSTVNALKYLYTPFWYVLDNSNDEFDVRAYSLDLPEASNLNFHRQNQTLQLFTNVDTYSLTKTTSGYELRILTSSGNYYKNTEDAEVGVQLAFHPYGEDTYAYINGVQESKTDDGERIFVFPINTNHDIDSSNLICVTNASVAGITDYQAWVELTTDIHLLHWTTSVNPSFVSDETDHELGKFLLPPGCVGNSHEILTLKMGVELSNLWRRARSYATDVQYQRHQSDIPLLYTQDVFDVDPATGAAFVVDGAGNLSYNYLHRVGDPVLNEDGSPVYKFKVGDVVLDAYGNPIPVATSASGRSFDILVVDGRYYFADDLATAAYRKEIEELLSTWITVNVSNLQKNALDRTTIFFYPKTTLGTISVEVENGGSAELPAEQSFKVVLFVKKAIYEDMSIRKTLSDSTIALLDGELDTQLVNMANIRESLKTLYGDSVDAFQIYGLGGDKDYQLVRVASSKDKFCLKKLLVMQADRTMFVVDDVDVQFKLSVA